MNVGDPVSRRSSRVQDGPGALRVIVVDEEGRAMRSGGLDHWLARMAPRSVKGTVSVALVSDIRVRRLNRTYRANDRATDVLSFPNAPGDVRGPRVGTDGPHLGDIVIAVGVAGRQARAAGHSERIEWRILALHGLLHLMGFDHETDAGAMARAERRLRRRAGLPEGLIDRESRAASDDERRLGLDRRRARPGQRASRTLPGQARRALHGQGPRNTQPGRGPRSNQ